MQQNQATPTSRPPALKISAETMERVRHCKQHLEQKYSILRQQEAETASNWAALVHEMGAQQLTPHRQESIKKAISQQQAQLQRQKRKKIKASDFTPLKIIGRGAFGEVRLCIDNASRQVVAIKKMNKSEMLNKKQTNHVRAERDVLVQSQNEWVVQLHYSFQDSGHLYLVMEYLQGGDLMTLLMKKDILSQAHARFYIAELVLAVESVHRINYIHRDLKPDNILIDSQGHIKLSDFGLCKNNSGSAQDHPWQKQAMYSKQQSDGSQRRQLAFSTVGTPDYIAPEVFGQSGYTQSVDYWSIGVILYEMLTGYPPFYSESANQTVGKIVNYQKYFKIPQDMGIAFVTQDLIKSLICDSSVRLTLPQIKAHPFFHGIDWNNIRSTPPPFVPNVSNEVDTQYFDHYDEVDPWISKEKSTRNKLHDSNFIGYTFKRELSQQKSKLKEALQELEADKKSQKSMNRESLIENNTQKFNKYFQQKNSNAPLQTEPDHNRKVMSNINLIQQQSKAKYDQLKMQLQKKQINNRQKINNQTHKIQQLVQNLQKNSTKMVQPSPQPQLKSPQNKEMGNKDKMVTPQQVYSKLSQQSTQLQHSQHSQQSDHSSQNVRNFVDHNKDKSPDFGPKKSVPHNVGYPLSTSSSRSQMFINTHQSPMAKNYASNKIEHTKVSPINLKKQCFTGASNIKTSLSPIGQKKNINASPLNQKIEQFKQKLNGYEQKKQQLKCYKEKENVHNNFDISDFNTPQIFKQQVNSRQNLSIKKESGMPSQKSNKDISFQQILQLFQTDKNKGQQKKTAILSQKN